MPSLQQQTKQQQHTEALCGAAIRALTGDPDLHLRARTLHIGRKRIAFHAPHMQVLEAGSQLQRGKSDAMALRMKYSNRALHRHLCPESPVQRLIFELLEQLRVESLVPAYLPGVVDNLHSNFIQWSRQFHDAGFSDTALGNLLFTLAQLCWSRLNAQPVLEEVEDFIEATRAGIVPVIGADLVDLKRYRNDQQAYAQAALSIAGTIAGMVETAQAQVESLEEDEDDPGQAALKFLLAFEDDEELTLGTVCSGESKVFAETDKQYRVYTREYDKEQPAAALVRPTLLRELRESLDQSVSQAKMNRVRLSRLLAAIFSQPKPDRWSFGEYEGYVDGRRLSQLIASPKEQRVFKQVNHTPKPYTSVTLLIDCSGSMQEHMTQVAILADVLGRALEKAQVPFELLGFTTGAWNGGRAQQDWMNGGRSPNPGRLNELNHIVYKAFATSWRQARPAVAALLKADLFREGIDGEAVDWACSRLLQQDTERRVLMVMSDGCPMDTATNLANDHFYLDNHLKTVVGQYERSGLVEIYGLGVGLDLSPYYPQCLALDLSEGISNEHLLDVVALLQGKRLV